MGSAAPVEKPAQPRASVRRRYLGIPARRTTVSDLTGQPEFFSICYLSANRHGERKGESPFRYRLAEIRDGGPMTFLASALSSLGLAYGGPIFNLPPPNGRHPALPERV